MKTSSLTHEIVLLHGLVRTPLSMYPLARFLLNRGYTVHNFGYRSHRYPLKDHTERLHTFLQKHCGDRGTQLHFITHSLGSLVARNFANRFHTEFQLGRIAMLGPPNQGSQVARFLTKVPGTRFLFGPVLKELASLSLPSATEHFEVGVVAGGIGHRIGMIPFVSGDNDGIVSVEETKLEGMKGYIRVPIHHALLMLHPRVWRLALRFIESGSFAPGELHSQ